MKIKKFCLRERNRFLKNLVYNQEAMTRRVVYYILFSCCALSSYALEKKREEKFHTFMGLRDSDVSSEIHATKPKQLIRKE